MKCPLCNAPTEVNQTIQKDGGPIRYRHCYNDHSFKTREITISEPRPKPKRPCRTTNPTGSKELVAV